ncbi:plasma membrane ATPase [Penicillium chermesinum]|uniref:Plasma membrane ATPase n=1 Tax=Penicillium chermesinum TaxID=63820 RepID=A0A9W9P7H7_9EURO|nr:plasma membrane ATPase [Penicillium chermesinum]KAJ5239416.1 plasma membrane ATPase [Penicillium chermesinum]
MGLNQPEQPLNLTLHDLSTQSLDQEMKDHLYITRQETTSTIDALITELEEEDGKEPDPEVVTIGPGTDRVTDPCLLKTDLSMGLTDEEVLSSRRKFGWNSLKEERCSPILKFVMLFIGPVQFVMELSTLLAAGLRDWIDFAVIWGLLLLNAIVSFGQEYHADNIVNDLKKTLALKATVIRNGQRKEIPAEDVVPGDVIEVEDVGICPPIWPIESADFLQGTIIPADAIIVTPSAHLQVDQSSVTGESLAVDKYAGERCFASSAVKRGSAQLVVTLIGDHTYVGRAAALVNQASQGKGHFTIVLGRISMILLILVLITLFIVWIACFYRSSHIIDILEFTLAITIIGVPVGLPVVVTTTLAVGASLLAKKSAVVQKLTAIESLAGVQILCTDKTGTLTRNKLTLGDPYTAPGVDKDDLMITACLAANRTRKGMDAIDRAFVKSLRFYPEAKRQIPSYALVEYHPFDPVSKKVTAVVEASDGTRVICVKGSPIVALNTAMEDGSIPDSIIDAYNSKVKEFASRGFRSLGVARKCEAGSWELLGIMPCLDPPRFDTASTIKEAQHLGLSIKMLTGDAIAIAKEAARQLGLGTNIYKPEELGVTGAGDLPGSEVNDFVEGADGFAEVYPEHKYAVVERLQNRGYLVAMTGDGVNDAASLKKADTGIAVEGASDAARSASDIVFLAPGLSAIVDAIKASRQIFHRMYSYVIYRIALSLHLMLFFGLWIVTLNRSLDLRLVVFLAIGADIATLAIAYDKAPYSSTPVKWNEPKLWGIAVILGVVLAGGSWLALGTILVYGEGGGIVENFGARDMVLFLEIALTQNWLIFITRLNPDIESSGWKQRLPSLKLFLAVFLVDVAATLACGFGVLEHPRTSFVAVIRVWVFSVGVSVVCAIMYLWLAQAQWFDDVMHGRSFRHKSRERSWEDFSKLDPELAEF